MTHQNLKLYLYSLILLPLIAFYLLFSYRSDFEIVNVNKELLSFEKANEYCIQSEARLPTSSEMFLTYTYQNHPNLNTNYFWVDEPKLSASNNKSLFNMRSGGFYTNKEWAKSGVICVKDSPNRSYSILIAIALTIFLIFIWFKYFKSKRVIDIGLLTILLISWLIFASYKIGSFEAPKTNYEFTTSSEIIFDFKKEVQISKIAFFKGIQKSGAFKLFYWEDDKWRLYGDNKLQKFHYSFRWESVKNTQAKTRFIRLEITKPPVSLYELRFLENNSAITDFSIRAKIDSNELQKLFDETHIGAREGYFTSFYFDEIYHSRSGYEIANGLDPYDKVHPMLGKILVGAGILIADMNPVGWRLANLIFGILLIIAIYFFGKSLFKSRFIGFFLGFLMTFDFMHLTQSRIGLIDSFGVFFILMSFYMFFLFMDRIKFGKNATKYLFGSGLFLGLGASVKWSALFGSAGLGIIILYLLYQNIKYKSLPYTTAKFFMLNVLAFVVLPVVIYIASFFPLFLKGDSLWDIVMLQEHMYSYHHGLTATHPYTSKWFSWPFIEVPMGYLRENYNIYTSSINAMGNPAIWWVAVVGLFYTLFSFIKTKDMKAFIILAGFLSLYLPYAFIERVMFIYHFYYAVPFLMLGLAYMVYDLIKMRFNLIYLVLGYMLIIVITFIAFYPVLTGIEIERAYVNEYLKWFPKWWF